MGISLIQPLLLLPIGNSRCRSIYISRMLALTGLPLTKMSTLGICSKNSPHRYKGFGGTLCIYVVQLTVYDFQLFIMNTRPSRYRDPPSGSCLQGI